MKAILYGDLHLESGAHLGDADPDLGNTRLADARRALSAIAQEEADVLIFLGDAARTATPKPTAYRIAQDALREAKAGAVVLLVGNHDFTGERSTCVHVIAEGLPRCRVFGEPQLTKPAGLQLGVLPWTPSSRLFAAAPHDLRRVHQLAAESLVAITRGMASQLDPAKPSLLVGHWLLSGGQLQTGASVIEAREPVLPAAELELQGWDAIVFGHNHRHQRAGERSWHCGPPLRGGFGEAEIETGYMVVEWDEAGRAHSRFMPIEDRRLLTVDLEGLSWRPPAEDVRDAIVRVRVNCTEREAEEMRSTGAVDALVRHLREAGAAKIVGPQWNIERAARERRSDLTVDVDPKRALTTWLDAQEIGADLRPLVESEAGRLMA